jgi:predicted permease
MAFYQRLAAGVRALPGVRAAGVGSDLPWTGYDENTAFTIAGRPADPSAPLEARYHFVTPGFAAALGTAIVAGRDFGETDTEQAPKVVVVNEAAARKYWRTSEEALGARLNLWGAERTIAGVLENVRDMPWSASAEPAIYFPQAQVWYPQSMFLVVRSDVDADSVLASIRRTIGELDPALPVANVRPLESVANQAYATRRFVLWLLAIFGATAVFLAMVGIYGVTAQAVGQRTREFGVRQALGATPFDIARLVLSSGSALIGLGIAAGGAMGVAATRLMSSLLFEVRPADPISFALAAAVLSLAALAATWIPARRATRVGPATALRD